MDKHGAKTARNVRRASLVLALTPIVSLPTTMAFAGALTPTPVSTAVTTTTPAPPATASATAASVAGIVTVGGTSTSAGGGGGSASADALDVLGTRVSGGDSNDPSKPASGSVFSTGTTAIGDAEVAPYSAAVTHSGDSSTADADAALAHAGLAGLLEIWVLHSHSHSSYTSSASQGSSSSDGAEVKGFGHDIKVLHAEASSGQTGKSDLLVVDGTEIGSSSQANGACKLSADPIITLLCLEANGGTSNNVTTSGADVVSTTGQLPATTLSGAGTKGGSGVTTSTPAGPAHKPATKPARGPLPHTNGPSLPHTGIEVGLFATYAAALVGLGAAIVASTRRRRATGRPCGRGKLRV